MEGPTITLLAPFLLLVVLIAALSRIVSEPEESRPILSAIRSRTAEVAVGLDLMRRNTFVFVSASNLSRRLDHRIEDEDGTEIGSVLEQPRPGRWAGDSNFPRIGQVRLEICDESGAKVAEIVRPFGPSLRALRFSDFERIADRLERSKAMAGSGSAKKRRHRWGPQPDEHVLEITAPVSDDLRFLMLGAAAAVFLVLQSPFFDNG